MVNLEWAPDIGSPVLGQGDWVPANDPCLQHAGAGMRGSPFHSEDLRFAPRVCASLRGYSLHQKTADLRCATTGPRLRGRRNWIPCCIAKGADLSGTRSRPIRCGAVSRWLQQFVICNFKTTLPKSCPLCWRFFYRHQKRLGGTGRFPCLFVQNTVLSH